MANEPIYNIHFWLDMRDSYLKELNKWPDSVYAARVVMEANQAIRELRQKENRNV
jgi:hypothetical protein